MNRFRKWCFVLLLILALAIPAQAAPPAWDLDPAHSGFYFGITHIHSTIRGYFEDFSGTLMFSPDDLAGSRFEFEVDVKSINTGNSKRDGHLNSPDFFDSKSYPQMTFKSTSVKHVEGDNYTVQGELTIKDVTQTVAVPFTFLGVTANPFDDKTEVAGFEARLTIDRLAYNVGNGKFYEMGVVGKDVEVLISLEAAREK
jgi:polyisoprenoid-binding protein YceI